MPDFLLHLCCRVFRIFWAGILFAGFCFPTSSHAQAYSLEEEFFAFRVKQIDEFFERFNNQETLIKEYVADKYNMTEISREELLKSLFDLRSGSIDKEAAFRFIKGVNHPQQPVYLSFYDDDWYAQVKCSVIYQEEVQDLLLILRVQKEKEGASRWVIESVQADFFNAPAVRDSSIFLNPLSHGTDFLGLSEAFEDKQNIQAYLPASFRQDQLSQLVLELQNGRVRFQQVEEVSYHFFQIEGWIVKVENFRRADQNAGWLISNLIQADGQTKKEYKQHILNLRI